VCLALFAFAAVSLGYVPPPHASTLLRIRAGALHVARGRLQPHAREHVAEILLEVGISRGFVAVTPTNRVTFSRNIPAAIHQRLRNVLLNQWS
jgi:hypothetical protein